MLPESRDNSSSGGRGLLAARSTSADRAPRAGHWRSLDAGGRAGRSGGGEVSWYGGGRTGSIGWTCRSRRCCRGREDQAGPQQHTTGRAAGRLKCLQLTARRSRKPARYGRDGAALSCGLAAWAWSGRDCTQHLTSGVRI
ncbi:hypothetical protein B0T18DRAFT_191406 [Schizothecium vesticola]|uniref:Uncharacterized protein n=1 Tax=Schizothecium vesticola TaxID=314040 RepID=A0AA40EQS6_9PEZI|nr:hypothetical protein B0T18DRAFT_191406 [Schizothecium vesticola]